MTAAGRLLELPRLLLEVLEVLEARYLWERRRVIYSSILLPIVDH